MRATPNVASVYRVDFQTDGLVFGHCWPTWPKTQPGHPPIQLYPDSALRGESQKVEKPLHKLTRRLTTRLGLV